MRIVFLILLLATFSYSVDAQDIAIVGAKVYTSPDAQPTRDTSILIRAGKIVAVGRHVRIPSGIPKLTCTDCVVFAGFWNSHVHFTEAKWMGASQQPAGQLARRLQEMVTGSGFTTVVDLSSDPKNTMALRRRIETGEVSGPRIFTAGSGLYPPHGIPYYLKDLPPEVLAHLPQPDSPAEAAGDVRESIAAGTDVVKLFTGSYVARGHIVAMPLPIAQSAVEAGHAHGKLVFAHPSNLEGVRVAMESGVDVLAHAPDTVAGVDDALIRELIAHHMAMVPTLKLFSGESDIERIRAIVARFHQLGGQLLFGTDTGFLTDYDVTEEYRQLSLAGLTYRDVLAMLTTAPAERFGVADHEGRIAPGTNGDLTVLSADPGAGDLTAFAHVRYAIRSGRVIAGSH